MKTYLFRTKTSVKENELNKIWVDSDIVPDFETAADDIRAALIAFKDWAKNKAFVDISDSALRRKMAMYIDTAAGVKQTGYVITGQIEIEGNDYKWTRHYIDLWVSINEIITPEF